MSQQENQQLLEPDGDKGDSHRATFIDLAMQSDCAASLNEDFVNRNAKDVELAAEMKRDLDKFKRDMFGRIYDHIGQDHELAKDLQAAVVVRNVSFSALMSTLLGILTLGFFYVLRPKDNDSIAILTKKGRVLTLKIEREGFFAANPLGAVLTFVKYLLLLAVAVSLPSLLLFLYLTQKHHTEKVNLDDAMQMQVATKLKENIKRHFIISAEVALLIFVVFLLWIWSKCPSDYGTRFRESYQAKTVAAGQLVIKSHLLKKRATSSMRLYFGRYPTQETMDMHGGGASEGFIVQSLKPLSLAATGSTGGGVKDVASLTKRAAGTPQRNAVLIVLVSAVTMIDTGLTWLDRANTMTEVLRTGQFCTEQPDPWHEAEAKEYCTQPICEAWARKNDHDPDFCMTVKWHDLVNSTSQIATCAYYGYAHPPCCGGCGIGQAVGELKEGGWFAALQEILGIVADVGTLAFSLMAAANAILPPDATDHFDIAIDKGITSSDDLTTNYSFTMPAAMNMFDAVFETTFLDDSGERKETGSFQSVVNLPPNSSGSWFGFSSRTLEPSAEAESNDVEAPSGPLAAASDAPSHFAAGVSNYVVDTESATWEHFLMHSSLTERSEIRGVHKARVPVKCLGLHDEKHGDKAEKVVAAWAERPPIFTFAGVFLPLLLGATLTTLLLFDPKSITGEEVHFPGMPKSGLGRMLSAVAVGVAASGGTIAVRAIKMLVNGIEHAVVVTDGRLFYIRAREPCWWLLNFNSSLRVDCFRHDRGVTYGNVSSMHRTLLQRLTGTTWLPGTVVMQNKFGVVEFTRSQGNVFNVFNIIMQLSPIKSANFISKELSEGAWDWDEAAKDADEKMPVTPFEGAENVRSIRRHTTDFVSAGPSLYMLTGGDSDETETPLFHWSFTKVGPLTSPLNTITDVIVTSGRVFLWKRASWKRFDCRTAFRSPLNMFAAMRAEAATNEVSFFALETLLSFSSAAKVKAPTWTDPLHQPVTCPLLDLCCRRLTSCFRCGTQAEEYDEEVEDEPQDEDAALSTAQLLMPLRAPPRVEMWLMFRLRTCAQQPDLIATCAPFRHKDFHGTNPADSFLASCLPDDTARDKTIPRHYEKVTTLRAIMGVAQEAAQLKTDKYGDKDHDHDR